MDSQTDTSYQDDILKVKRIWNDIKQFDNKSAINNKRQKQNKNKKEQKDKERQKTNTKSKSNIINNHLKSTQAPKPSPQVYSPSQSASGYNKRDKHDDGIIQFSTTTKGNNKKLIQNSPNNQYIQHSKNNNNKEGVIQNNSNYRQVYQLNQKIQSTNQQLSLLRVTNQRYKDLVRTLQSDLKQKDRLIDKLKERQSQLLGETNKFKSGKQQMVKNNVEYQNYKNDAKRLLKMLQATQEYQYFAKFALQDHGSRFLHEVNKSSKKSVIDLGESTKHFHFCSCNKQFIPEPSFWVPQKAYDLSKQFVEQKTGEVLTNAELELFMYELNKIWRERQKKIVNSMNSMKANEIGKYKRKLQNVSNYSQSNERSSRKIANNNE